MVVRLAWLVVIVGCGSSAHTGELNEACFANLTCFAPLACVANRCVSAAAMPIAIDVIASPDAGSRDGSVGGGSVIDGSVGGAGGSVIDGSVGDAAVLDSPVTIASHADAAPIAHADAGADAAMAAGAPTDASTAPTADEVLALYKTVGTLLHARLPHDEALTARYRMIRITDAIMTPASRLEARDKLLAIKKQLP